MFQDIQTQIVTRLETDYQLKARGQHLREGVCPSCGKKSLWTWADSPGSVQCDRQSKCGYQSSTKDLFPDLFEHFNKQYPATPTHPNQTADAYLTLIRGFDVSKIEGWYEQGNYWHSHGDKGTASVRFYLDAGKHVYWERLIEDVTITQDDGSAEIRNKNFKGSFKGLWWKPPGFHAQKNDAVYLCEGILDAIALNLSGVKACAIMSSGTFPSEDIKPYLGKQIHWILALDNDKAGRKALAKHAKTLKDLGERVSAALSSETEEKADWNDLYRKKQLTPDDLKLYRHYGALALAGTNYEKARLLWRFKPEKTYFVFDFKQSLYSFSIDASEYKKTLDRLLDQDPFSVEKQELNAFMHCAKLKPIATFTMQFLYFQQSDTGDEGQYFFRFLFSNDALPQQLAFPGKIFGGAGDFKKAVMQKTPSALFTGGTKDLDYLYQQWMGKIPRIVKTLDFIGYDDDTQAYVFHDYAVQHGKVVNVNSDEFFQLKTTGIKTIVPLKQKLTTAAPKYWLHDYQTAFGVKGMVALAWWFGSLFAQQLRRRYQSYPFFEIIGEAGSGKTDMVDFLFKLIGKENDNFNPNISTMPGFIRKLSESSNMPVVFNETDNEQITADRHQRKFDWEIAKDWYNGQIGRYVGKKSNDNSTRVHHFKTALMAVQNVPVVASEAISSRFAGIKFDRSHHSDAGKLASERLQMLDVLDVSGFLLQTVQQEQRILETFEPAYRKHYQRLGQCAVKMQRIRHNHAMLMALVDCLGLDLPLQTESASALREYIMRLAETRQETLNADHPTLQTFWAQFDYLDVKTFSNSFGEKTEENQMNHLGDDPNYIAVNIEHYLQRCTEAKLTLLQPLELRRLFPTSRARPFVENKKIRSRLLNRPLNCYIFKKHKDPS